MSGRAAKRWAEPSPAALPRRGLFLTVAEVAAELGLDPQAARTWLVEHDLIRVVGGAELVIPDALLEAVRRGGPGRVRRSSSPLDRTWLTTAEAAERLGVDRGVLDIAAPVAVQICPNLVTVAGQGKKHRTYRWLADGLGEALARARASMANAAPTVEKRPRTAPRKSQPRKLRALLREGT